LLVKACNAKYAILQDRELPGKIDIQIHRNTGS
jgi:hypothetical protein